MSDDLVTRLVAAVEAEPHRRLLRIELANALLHVGHFDDALDQVRRILAASPGDPEALGLAAMACELAGDPSTGAAYAALLRQQIAGAVASDPLRPTPLNAEQIALTVPLVSFADVVGYTDEKRRFDGLVLQPVRHHRDPDAAAQIPSGLLLYGPAGSGKSHLAHAIAGELHLNLVKVNVASAVDPWGAALPGAIRRACELARDNAPSLLLLEEIEAVGHRRLRFTPHGREALDELIEVLDQNDRTKVLIVASTTAPWMINPVLRGDGRFDRSILVGPPDCEAREATLERLARTRLLPVQADLHALAARCEGCTTDDLNMLFSVAAELAFRDVVDRAVVVPLDDRHFDSALERINRSANAWFDMAYNFPEFTDDSSEFDPLFDYIRRNVRRLG